MIKKLVVLPTEETLVMLRTRFSELPVVIDYDSLNVEIGSRNEAYDQKIEPRMDVVYRALPGSIGIWYEAASSVSWIILPLVPSPEMCDRRMEIGDYYGRIFVPYLALSSQFNSHRVKPRLNSIATGLVESLPMFTFSYETVVNDDGIARQRDFYEDYVLNGGHLTNQFLDVTK